LSLPTDLKIIDENVVTSLDSVLMIPDPLIPFQFKEQAVNRLKVAKNRTKWDINLLLIKSLGFHRDFSLICLELVLTPKNEM
jgi:hypothetical protein